MPIIVQTIEDALVRQIARLHGGDAMVKPRPDAPSCIVVELAPMKMT